MICQLPNFFDQRSAGLNKIKPSKARRQIYRLKRARIRPLLIEIILLSMLGGLFPASGPAAESGLNEVGVIMGIQEGSREGRFRCYQAFATHRLPWDWRTSSGWGVGPLVTSSLGFLQGGGAEGVYGSAGIALAFDKKGPGIGADIGTSVSIMNRRRFGSMDFGSTLQYISHAGISYRFDNGLKIGYRWQHMSNGHVFYPESNPNPGLNMHMLGISRVF